MGKLLCRPELARRRQPVLFHLQPSTRPDPAAAEDVCRADLPAGSLPIGADLPDDMPAALVESDSAQVRLLNGLRHPPPVLAMLPSFLLPPETNRQRADRVSGFLALMSPVANGRAAVRGIDDATHTTLPFHPVREEKAAVPMLHAAVVYFLLAQSLRRTDPDVTSPR